MLNQTLNLPFDIINRLKVVGRSLASISPNSVRHASKGLYDDIYPIGIEAYSGRGHISYVFLYDGRCFVYFPFDELMKLKSPTIDLSKVVCKGEDGLSYNSDSFNFKTKEFTEIVLKWQLE